MAQIKETGLRSLLLSAIDPFGMMRNFLLKPASEVATSVFEHYRTRTKEGVISAREVLIRVGLIAFIAAIVIWTSVFMYLAFYYTYMPAIAHIRPVHMQFSACESGDGPCSFPSAHVSLTKKQQLLMVGQSYKVHINIDMPETPQNVQMGMFMVCAEMRDQKTTLRAHSCRTSMLRYKSPLFRNIYTWVMSPLLISGFREESQMVPVELFNSYEDDKSHPVTDVYVEIQSKHIQFYSVTLHISAHFTGLRYIMFNWPIASATVGICTNLFFILTICFLSWYHWSDTNWLTDARRQRDGSNKSTRSMNPRSGLDTDFSTSVDESNNILDEDDELSILDDKSTSKSDIEDISSEDGVLYRPSAKS